jgi:AmmeMemoRadiSam system protein B
MIKAIIGPHAGYTYSGATAAWGYRYLQEQNSNGLVKCSRIFLLGPSHKVYIKGCAISGLGELETPLGNLKIDV